MNTTSAIAYTNRVTATAAPMGITTGVVCVGGALIALVTVRITLLVIEAAGQF